MARLERRVVAVVDDDAGVREALSQALVSVSVQVAGYNCASAFLDDFPHSSAECLIIDVRLPGMSGLDLLDLLQQRGDCLPTVVISAFGDVPMAVRAMKAGALDFLEKPFCVQTLLDVVHHAFREADLNKERQVEKHEFERRLVLLTPRERQVMKLVVAGKSNK